MPGLAAVVARAGLRRAGGIGAGLLQVRAGTGTRVSGQPATRAGTGCPPILGARLAEAGAPSGLADRFECGLLHLGHDTGHLVEEERARLLGHDRLVTPGEVLEGPGAAEVLERPGVRGLSAV